MAPVDRYAADTAVLTANVNALLVAAAVVVADGTAGTSQPHLDTLAATLTALGATRARMVRMSNEV